MFNRNLKTFLCVWMCAGMAVAQAAPENMTVAKNYQFFPYGWYQGMKVGVTSGPRSTASGGGQEFAIDYNKDHSAGVQLGYQNCHWRYELEMGYWRNRLENMAVNRVPSTTPSGRTDLVGLLGNIYYDVIWGPRPNLMPYLGAGLGMVNFRDDIDTSVPNQLHGHNRKMAYQGTLGMAYRVTDAFSVGLDYRYITTQTASFNGFTNSGLFIGDMKHQFKSHTVNFGFLYRFV